MSFDANAKRAADRTDEAARRAKSIFSKAEDNAKAVSKANPVMRKAADTLKHQAERLETIIEVLGKPNKESGVAAHLDEAAAMTKTASYEIKNLGDVNLIADDIRKADEELSDGKNLKATGKADDGKEAEGAQVGKKEKEISNAAEKVKTDLNESGLSKVKKELEKTCGALRLAEDAARKNPDDWQSIKDAIGKAVKGLKKTVALLKEAEAKTQEKLKWPTFDIWKSAFEMVAQQTRMADENAGRAKRIYEESESPDDKVLADSAAENRNAIKRIEDEARKNFDSARTAEVLLKVVGFFDDHKQQIYDRLEECDRIAQNAVVNPNTLFIAESLPIINGIIHMGSTREELNKATEWVRKYWEASEAHPRIVLSALLLHYVTERGHTDHSGPEDVKREIWERIENRVRQVL